MSKVEQDKMKYRCCTDFVQTIEKIYKANLEEQNKKEIEKNIGDEKIK